MVQTFLIEITDTEDPTWVRRGKTTAQSKNGLMISVKKLGGWTCKTWVEVQGDKKIFTPVQKSNIMKIATVTPYVKPDVTITPTPKKKRIRNRQKPRTPLTNNTNCGII